MLSIPDKINSCIKIILRAKIKYLYAGIRRRVIFYFLKGYLKRQLARRKGRCSGEGSCCKTTLPWCAYLKDKACLAYANQPLFCNIFPVDEKDLELSDVFGLCTYYFE